MESVIESSFSNYQRDDFLGEMQSFKILNTSCEHKCRLMNWHGRILQAETQRKKRDTSL
jgi:hypothetical protein